MGHLVRKLQAKVMQALLPNTDTSVLRKLSSFVLLSFPLLSIGVTAAASVYDVIRWMQSCTMSYHTISLSPTLVNATQYTEDRLVRNHRTHGILNPLLYCTT